jgi:hypothetical protein
MRILLTDPAAPGAEAQPWSSWPVTEDRFYAFVAHAHRSFDRVHAALPPEWADLLLADYRFITLLLQLTHAQAAAAWATRHRAELIIGPGSKGFYAPTWADIGSVYARLGASGRTSLDRIREMRRRFVYNDHLPLGARFRASTIRPPVSNLGSLHDIKLDFIRARKVTLDFPVFEALAAASARQPLPPRAANVLEDFFTEMSQASADHLGHRAELAEARTALVKRLEDLSALYFALVDQPSVPRELLVGSAGNAIVRTVALAARRREAKVTSFLHGSNIGYTYEADRSYLDVSIATEFVAPTWRAARSLERLARVEPFTAIQPVTFSSVETRRYFEALQHSSRRRSPPSRRRRVLLAGFAFGANRYSYGVGLFGPMRLDLELRIIDCVRRADCYLAYKAHPSSQEVARRVFAGRVDRFETAPFEAVMHDADVLLFTYPQTSALGSAVTTTRPIVLLDVDDPDWNPEVYASLATRCTMVPASIEESCRITFEEERLLDALAHTPVQIDYSYVFDFLVPDGMAPRASRGERSEPNLEVLEGSRSSGVRSRTA